MKVMNKLILVLLIVLVLPLTVSAQGINGEITRKKTNVTASKIKKKETQNASSPRKKENSSNTTTSQPFSEKPVYSYPSEKQQWNNPVPYKETAEIISYKKELEQLGTAANAHHYRKLADLYIDQMAGADEATKIAALRKADEVYSIIASKFDYAKDYAAYQRGNIHHQLNTDLKKGEAKPYYEEYIRLVEPKTNKSTSEKSKLAVAYQYLAVHFIQNDQVAKAKEYAAKLLQYKPDDDTAKQIMAL